MGGAVSTLGAGLAHITPGAVKGLVKHAGLPLEVEDDDEKLAQALNEPAKPPPPSAYTQSYDAEGFFTGVKSTITIQRSPSAVYNSLSKDLHKVFTPITECHDTVEKDSQTGEQQLFRVVRIPFRVVCVSGNLKMRLRVNQDRRKRTIHFTSLKEGRLISDFLANFEIVGDSPNQTTVHLDAKIAAKQLPPPPFKGIVKGVMIHKIDNCMLDLLAFHERAAAEEKDGHPLQKAWSGAANILAHATSLSDSQRSFASFDQQTDKSSPSFKSSQSFSGIENLKGGEPLKGGEVLDLERKPSLKSHP